MLVTLLSSLPPVSQPKTLFEPSLRTHFPSRRSSKIRFPQPRGRSSDEFPVGYDDDEFLKAFSHKDKETEDEARRKNWIERGWAPWEEVLSPEAAFARASLNEGEEVPLQTPEAIEAFKMLSPKYRKEKMEEMGLTEDDYYRKQFDIKGEIPEPLVTSWTGPLMLGLVPPRDWPPRGWKVDRKELEFIRGAHKVFSSVRIDLGDLEDKVEKDDGKICIERYKAFLKQYQEWVEANRTRLEEQSYKHDQDYHHGRRKRGQKYNEKMYELPFYFPGQICAGKVVALHLYQGAFVDIGGVYDGWVPIKGNDWFWLRHHIKVGMHVMVEILAKRDPYRFRFPIEMRFVDPNIDHLIFNRFDFPPIFHRDEDQNPDELRRDCGRQPIPRKDPGIKWEDQPLLSDHPYVDKLWEIHNVEQMILNDVEANPEKYENQKLSELVDDDDFDEENAVEYGEAIYKKTKVPRICVKVSVKELDLEAALAERQFHRKSMKEAAERGESYRITSLRRNEEMDEYDLIHWRRSFEEREALLRDIACRRALGLPSEEPGRYADPSVFKDEYDPDSPLYRHDYWGEPKNSEKSQQERMTEAHNKSIVGNGTVWYEMPYEDAVKQQAEREALGIELPEEEYEESDLEENDDEEDDDDDFDYSILSSPNAANEQQLHVNGTETLRLSDEGML